MAREADIDLSRGHDDDAWFDEGGGAPGSRDKRARMILAAAIVLLLLLGLVLGAFSSPEPPPGPDLARLRERARAAATPSALQAGGNDALYTGLERLVTAMPKPEPVADVVAAPTDAAGGATDAVAAAEVEAGPVVAKVEPPKPKDTTPKDTTPKDPKPAKDPTGGDNAFGIPTLDPKKVEPKKEDPKPGDDPKLKAPIDQALADAKAHLDAGRWGDAKSGYEKALALSPGNTRALLGRGRAYLELKQVQPAIKDIKAVLEAEPRNPTALLLAGSISQELGQKDQARGFYQRYLDAWPSGRKAAEVKALLERL